MPRWLRSDRRKIVQLSWRDPSDAKKHESAHEQERNCGNEQVWRAGPSNHGGDEAAEECDDECQSDRNGGVIVEADRDQDRLLSLLFPR